MPILINVKEKAEEPEEISENHIPSPHLREHLSSYAIFRIK